MIIVISLIIIITSVIALRRIINNLISKGSAPYTSTYSINESKKKKLFIKDLIISPQEIIINNEKIIFNECWIEKRINIKYFLYFFENREYLDSYHLVFNLKNNYQDKIWKTYIFIIENRGQSFAQQCCGKDNYYVLNDIIDDIKIKNFKINIKNNWNSDNIAIVNFINK